MRSLVLALITLLCAEATDEALLVIDLPFAHGEFADESSSMIGNPYIGVLLGERRDDARFELGARLPIGAEGEFASLIGSITDIQRIEAFSPDLPPAAFPVRRVPGYVLRCRRLARAGAVSDVGSGYVRCYVRSPPSRT